MKKEGKATAAEEQAQAEAIYCGIIDVINAQQPLIANAVINALATALAEATGNLPEEKKIWAIQYAASVIAEHHNQNEVQLNQIN
jgi:hypothetical protein